MKTNRNENRKITRIGRPTSHTEDKAARIVEAIRQGMPYKLAASAGGVSYNTFVRWRNEGTNPNAPEHLREFSKQVREAEAEAAQRLYALIIEAAESGKKWQAAAWMLERRHPDLFGKDVKPPSRPIGNNELDIWDYDDQQMYE